jgi:hypothetical protein
MSHHNKKERHKAKREAKRRETRRRESVSPIKRLAQAPGDIECWMTKGFFEANGQIQMFVYKRAGGLTGIACFLVDQGVVGLKDSWARLHMDRMEFDSMLAECTRHGMPMTRASVDDVRRIVAGGIRWAFDNGMRLPKNWENPASLFGGVGEWKSADVSLFVMEFAGHPEDLRQRLIGAPFDNYIRRTDIQFVFSDSAPYMDQETGEYSHEAVPDPSDLDEDELESIAADLPKEEIDALVERFSPSSLGLAQETAAWLAARNESPSPGLSEAWQSMLIAFLLSQTAMPDAPDEEIADFGIDLLRDLSGRIAEERYAEYDRAVGQALEYLETDPKVMQKAVLKFGLGGESID